MTTTGAGLLEHRLSAYAAAKNDHDLDRAMSFCSPDCTYENAGPGPLLTGHAQLRGYYTALWAAIPDYRFTLEGTAFDEAGGSAVAWGRVTGTVTGPELGLSPNGRALDFPIVFVCRFDADGVLVEDKGYYDLTTVLAQAAATADAAPGAADFFERFKTAWASRAPEALGALFHAEAEVRYPLREGVLDRQGVIDFWRDAFALTPDVSVEALRWSSNGDDVFIEWRAVATIHGQPTEWCGVDRFTLRDRLAVAESTYFDTAPLMRALAGPPPA